MLMTSHNTRKMDATYFADLWDTRQECRLDHSPEMWDDRAQKWIDDLGPDGLGKQGMNERVSSTARYLRARGLLGADSSVIDVGCGPGLFVMEFANTVRQAVGLDHSSRFVAYAAACSEARRIRNVSFIEADFLALNVEKACVAVY